jgi:hypothetical protein
MGQRGAREQASSVVLVDSTHVETHRVDLSRCWAAWRAIQGAEGRLHTFHELAAASDVSVVTARRFMTGRRHVSLRSGRRILGTLNLELGEVGTSLTPDLVPAC